MMQVSKEAFFAAMNPLNVHPRPDIPSLKGRYHTTIWEMPDRRVIGKDTSDSHIVEPTRYWLVNQPAKR